MLVEILRPLDLVIFVTPLVRKLYFGGCRDFLFGTCFCLFSGVGFRGVVLTALDLLWCTFGLHFGACGLPLQALFCRPFFDGFWVRGGGARGRGQTPKARGPPLVNKEIWPQNHTLVWECCIFQKAGILLPLKELTKVSFFRKFRKEFQPEGGDPEGSPELIKRKERTRDRNYMKERQLKPHAITCRRHGGGYIGIDVLCIYTRDIWIDVLCLNRLYMDRRIVFI